MSGISENLKKHIFDEVIGVIETTFISLFVITMFFTFVLRIATVKGDSMVPTLLSNQKLLITSWLGSPEKGDIIIIDCRESVVFSADNTLEYRDGLNKHIVKRVIACEGQKINIDFKTGNVYVDDVLLDEPYVTGLTHKDEGAFTGKYPFTVPDGYVFVMGDNRAVSRDSRDVSIGLVSKKSILGKAVFRVSPFSEFGFIGS